MTHLVTSKTDLRELAEQHLGKPLAASANAALWRCPVCPLEAHSLLLVAADQYRCMGRYLCDGGVSEWVQNIETTAGESTSVVGETA